jgi:hypothetical protein
MRTAANAARLVAGLLSALSAGQALAGDLSQQERLGLLHEALKAFDRGTALADQAPQDSREAFGEAADKFQQIVDSGVRNGRLYYNLGNARLKCGQTGLAIANYLRARKLIPGDARLEENLTYARSLCRYSIPESGQRAATRTVFFWHYGTPLRLRLWVGLAAYVLFWSCLIARTLIGRIRWIYPAVGCLVICTVLAVSVGVGLKQAATQRDGVITGRDVVVRKGNGLDYAPQFEQRLSEGIEFEVLEERGSWLHVRLADGQDGWIEAAQADLV